MEWLIPITSCSKPGGLAYRPTASAIFRLKTYPNPKQRKSRWILASINLTLSASAVIVGRYFLVLGTAARNTVVEDTPGRCWTARQKLRLHREGRESTMILKTQVLRVCPLWSTRVTPIQVSDATLCATPSYCRISILIKSYTTL